MLVKTKNKTKKQQKMKPRALMGIVQGMEKGIQGKQKHQQIEEESQF